MYSDVPIMLNASAHQDATINLTTFARQDSSSRIVKPDMRLARGIAG